MYWRYIAINKYVHEITGVLYGSREQVLIDLQDKHLNVISIRPDILELVKMTFFSGKFTSKQMAIFFKDFGNMLETGLTVPHILKTLRGQTLDGRLASLYTDMSNKLRQGEALSACFKETGKFPDLVISVISSGEQAGQLPLTMETLSEYYSTLDDMKGRIWGASLNPIFIVSVLLFTLVYLSINVMPHLRDILPPAALNNFVTVFMLGLADFLQHDWLIVLLLPMVVVALFFYMKYLMREKLDFYIFKIPYIGGVLRDYEISIVFLSIWVLHRAGVTIDIAFKKIIDSNKTYTAQQLESCLKFLVAGYSISESLKQNPFFPGLIVDTVRIGEEMGRYDEYFERIYRVYKNNFQSRLDVFIKLVEPALLIFCGIFLFLMIAAFLKPIYGNLGNISAATMK
jgi:type II secretory pathway component PulF